MLVFLFTDIEGSTRLWEQHTGAMGAVIERHDAILRERVEAAGGRITKHTGDGVTAAFVGGEPMACALATQVSFAAESWGAIGELRIRIGLHAGEAEWLGAPGGPGGDYHGPPVNCTARVMSAAWGGQILLTPEVTGVSPLPPGANLLDLGEHLLKNVSAPQQIFQLLHADLPRRDFPPPRTLSGQAIRQAVGQQGPRMANLAPPEMAVMLVSATLLPAVLGEQPAGSAALAGNVGVLRDLGAEALAVFLGQFAEHQPVGTPEEIWGELERELQRRWAGDAAIREDASRLLQAVHGVEATLMAATGEVKSALARGLAVLGGQFDEFRWMLGDVQETLAEMQGMQRQQLDLQQRQLARTEELLALHKGQAQLPPTSAVVEPAPQLRVPAFLDKGARDVGERAVFVAREAELARLNGFLEQALAGRGRVVFVSGDAGRGKTALLAEFARQAMEAQPDLLVANGNCNAYSGIGDPFLPFRDVMGMLTGDVEARWSAGDISRDHALRLWGALPLAVQAVAEHGPHVVPALVSGPPLLSRAKAVAPAGARWLQRLGERVARQPAGSEGLEQSALFQQVTNLLRALAETHPLLLILDDLQWADSASMGLLFHLGRRLEGSRILIAGAYRPAEVAVGRDGSPSVEGVHPGERGPHPLSKVLSELKRQFGDIWVDLAEVEEPDVRQFVDAFLDLEPNRLGEGFRKELYDHAGGHPLFTVELVRAMQERGDLVRDRTGNWVAGPALDWETLPARVEGVIEERIGRLDDELRELLSVASVEGEEFTVQVAARVQDVAERQVLRRLARELTKVHRLVVEQSSLQVGSRRLSRFRFAHTVFQQYLYRDLTEGERVLLHADVAAVLEELYEGHLEEVAVRLARHFAHAGDDGRALKYLIMAGDGALAAYAYQEAEDHYRPALDLAPGEPQRAQLLTGLGKALMGRGRLQGAIQTFRDGIELYRAMENSDGAARLYSQSAEAATSANDPEEALRLCLEGLGDVAGAPDSPGLARLLHSTALVYGLKALPEEGRGFAQRALEMAERLGDVEAQAEALATLGGFYQDGEDAIHTLVQAVELAKSHTLLGVASRALNNLGVAVFSYRGDWRAGLEHYRSAAQLASQAGHTDDQLFYLSNALHGLLLAGELEQAEVTLAQARALLTDLPEPTFGKQVLLTIEAARLRLQGEWAASAQQARRMQASARERGNEVGTASACLLLGLAVLESRRLGGNATVDDLEEAEAALAEAIEIWDRSVHQLRGVQVRACLGSLRLEQGGLSDAQRLLAESRQLADSPSAVSSLEDDLLRLAAQIAGAEGRWGEAVEAHEAVAGVYARRGMRWMWARSLLNWAEAHVARGEPGDQEQAVELLREAQAAFEEMGIDRYAAIAQERLAELRQSLVPGSDPRESG